MLGLQRFEHEIAYPLWAILDRSLAWPVDDGRVVARVLFDEIVEGSYGA